MHIPALNGEPFPASAGMTGANSIRNTTARFIHQFQCLLVKSTCESILEKNFSLHNLIILKRPEGKCKYCFNDLTRYLQSSKGLKIFNCINERFSFNTLRIGRVMRPTFQIAESFQVSLNDEMKKNMQINNILR